MDSLERSKRASLRKVERLERERLAFRKEAIRKSKLCDHFIGECYESLANNIPREVYHLSEARKRFRKKNEKNWEAFGEVLISDYFRWIYKYCPMCGVRIGNLKKLLRPRREHASRSERTWLLGKTKS